MERDAVAEPQAELQSVSARAAVLRAATGFGVSTAIVALIALVWRDVLDLALLCVLAGSIRWLYEPKDAHSKLAIIAAGGSALLVGVGVAALNRQSAPDFSRDVAIAALGALVGSQVYAAITRRRS